MAQDITLPKLSDTMEEGKVLRWLKKIGDAVAAGDVVAEVETDKADMEVEAGGAGVLSEIRVQEGETAAVGAVLGVLDGEGGGAGADKKKKAKPEGQDETQGEAGETEARSAVGRKAAAGKEGSEPVADDAAKGDVEADAEDGAAAPPAADAAKGAEAPHKASAPARPLRASPLAQRLARERGLDLQQVRGSGAEGKIVARDVGTPADASVDAPAEEPAERAPRAAKAAATPAPGRLELSKMRQSIARRMAEAKNGIPHFYVTAEIDMGDAAHLLEALKKQVDAKITVSHLVAKAAAMALVEHPRVNGQWADGAVLIPSEVNIGLAVAVDDGLIVPVIHGCESLSLRDLASEARRLVAAAREGHFSGGDLKGGTFSISNLGILDVDEFSAIINPPQAAILAVGSIKERPVVRAGQLAVGRTMRVTLSCDHRQLNGVEGAKYLETLRSILENPLQMVV